MPTSGMADQVAAPTELAAPVEEHAKPDPLETLSEAESPCEALKILPISARNLKKSEFENQS